MVTVEHPADLSQFVGKRIGSSDWVQITQDMINTFAKATLDHQWIHVDVERVAREIPGGKTIAHGYLTLSLVAGLTPQIYTIEKRSRGVNYGLNKVRFTNMVPVDSRIRVHMSINQVEPIKGGVRATCGVEVEIEGQDRPALVAETITVAYD